MNNQSDSNVVTFQACAHTSEWLAAKRFRQTYFFDKVPIEDPYVWTFNHPDHAHFVLYEGNKIIGYAHIQLWPESRAALRIIVIEAKKQNQGFGAQFLREIEKWLSHKHVKSLHIESSPMALAFYEKHEYKAMPFLDPEGHETHPNDTAIGKDLCILR